MIIISFIFHVLTWLFLIGVAGSFVVIFITTVEDMREIFTSDENMPRPPERMPLNYPDTDL